MLNEVVCLGIDDRSVLHSDAYNEHSSDVKHIRLTKTLEARNDLIGHVLLSSVFPE